MATNPMQRKARNSFLLGMLVMLLLASIAIGFLLMQLMEVSKREKEAKVHNKSVYALKEDVSSGQVITPEMLKTIEFDETLAPSNATGSIETFENYALQDKEGHEIYTKYEKSNESKDKNNETKPKAKLYIKIDNREYEVKQEEGTDNYYYENNDEKKFIELNSVPLIAKVSMKANTILTTDLLAKGDSTMQKDVRKQEYNMLVLPMDLATGEYVDVRLMLPSGQDYIVVAKKEVEIPVVGSKDSSDTIWMNLSEDEILHMSCAIIDAYKISGAKLYVTKYTEAGIQEAAIPTYPINEATSKLLRNDPNILEKAMNEISRRYNEREKDDNDEKASSMLRNRYINSELGNQGDQAESNYQTNMSESITNSKKTRKEYLDSLSGGAQ